MPTTSILIKSTLIIFFTSWGTFLTAQVNQTAELKVSMNDVLTFTLNDANPTLIFDDADDFINGVTYTATNAATVTSSRTFDLKVKAENRHLIDGAGNKIAVRNIFIEPKGTNLGTTRKKRIIKNKRIIISNAPACISKSIDLVYSTEPNDKDFIGKPAGDYTVELLFIASLD